MISKLCLLKDHSSEIQSYLDRGIKAKTLDLSLVSRSPIVQVSSAVAVTGSDISAPVEGLRPSHWPKSAIVARSGSERASPS
ncbi:unnamed protein product [Cuscuta campestris]|uniref:Uncharacterized protein n=1 Tax=Cuscuta campestris TaxID=132261 RepID=A0A484MQV7_9ASTE|nr:unnamed protein product [Cuscuta campestris]